MLRTKHTYDDLDRLTSETHSSGFGASYTFDDAGRRTSKQTAPFDVDYTAGSGDRLAAQAKGTEMRT